MKKVNEDQIYEKPYERPINEQVLERWIYFIYNKEQMDKNVKIKVKNLKG